MNTISVNETSTNPLVEKLREEVRVLQGSLEQKNVIILQHEVSRFRDKYLCSIQRMLWQKYSTRFQNVRKSIPSSTFKLHNGIGDKPGNAFQCTVNWNIIILSKPWLVESLRLYDTLVLVIGRHSEGATFETDNCISIHKPSPASCCRHHVGEGSCAGGGTRKVTWRSGKQIRADVMCSCLLRTTISGTRVHMHADLS